MLAQADIDAFKDFSAADAGGSGAPPPKDESKEQPKADAAQKQQPKQEEPKADAQPAPARSSGEQVF